MTHLHLWFPAAFTSIFFLSLGVFALTGEAETWLGLTCGAAGVVFLVIAVAAEQP